MNAMVAVDEPIFTQSVWNSAAECEGFKDLSF